MRGIYGDFGGGYPILGIKDRVIFAPTPSVKFSCRLFRRYISSSCQISERWKGV